MKCEICGTELVQGVCPECGGADKFRKEKLPKKKKENQQKQTNEEAYYLKDIKIEKINLKKWAIGVISSLLVFIFLVVHVPFLNSGFQSVKETAGFLLEKMDANAIKVTIHPEEIASKQIFDAEFMQKLFLNPESYNGEYITMGGMLSEVSTWQNGGYYFRLQHDFGLREQIATVFLKAPFMTLQEIENYFNGPYVSIQGTIRENPSEYLDEKYRNAVYIEADTFTKVAYSDAFSPATYVAKDFSAAILQNCNSNIQVNRIEYSSNQTRFYITIQNNSNSELIVKADKEQLKESRSNVQKSQVNGTLPGLFNEPIKPGEIKEGIIVFANTNPSKKLEFSFAIQKQAIIEEESVNTNDKIKLDSYTFLFKPEK